MSERWTIILVLILMAWLAFIAAVRLIIMPWLARGPNRDPVTGFMWRLIKLYVWLVHRATFHGLEQFRNQPDPGALIVVSNHTGAVDPLLIQAGCRFHIRWLMASEMITPWLGFLWERSKPIPVDRDGRDLASAREAIRHLHAGGVLGIFPEGRIVNPPRQIRPFFTGVGLIVARTKVPVMLVWVSGTPDTTSMTSSLLTRSRARVQYIELIEFKGERDAHVITQLLREHLAAVSGWPLNDEPVPPAEGRE